MGESLQFVVVELPQPAESALTVTLTDSRSFLPLGCDPREAIHARHDGLAHSCIEERRPC